MNNRNKAFSLILYSIWPFSSVIIGIRNFNDTFGRRLLVAAFVFLGLTALSTGDLERYTSYYYKISEFSLEEIINLFFNLQIGKFFTQVSAVLFSVFNNHHIYFGFLFGVFGYFLVNTIDLLRLRVIKKNNFSLMITFLCFAFFYSVLALFNYAFYTGAIYFLYYLLKILLNEQNKKYYFYIFLTPLFHIGLTPLLLVPVFYFVFNRRTKFYILLLLVFTVLPRSVLISSFDKYLVSSDTVIEEKYNAYASEEGKERMDSRYENTYRSNNLKYKFFTNLRRLTNIFAVPFLLFILFYNREKFKPYPKLFNLFNVSIACLAITHLMLKISQGERFYLVSGFMILGAYVYFIQIFGFKPLKLKFPLYFILPIIVLNNLVNLVLAKDFISLDFIGSNLPVYLFGLE